MTHIHRDTKPQCYTILVAGRLDEDWSDWFDGFEITHRNGETVLCGCVEDSSKLFGILAKIAHLNLTLLYVQHVKGDRPCTR